MSQKTLKSFGDRVRWDLLPVYVLLAGLTAWLTAVTMIVMAEAGAPETIVSEISTAGGLLAVVAALTPFLDAAGEVVIGRWRS